MVCLFKNQKQIRPFTRAQTVNVYTTVQWALLEGLIGGISANFLSNVHSILILVQIVIVGNNNNLFPCFQAEIRLSAKNHVIVGQMLSLVILNESCMS